ncbi:spire type actin nucleation factor 2 [Turdus rufiventris]|nr:spire type actin nucleation factor 2 [Turdus rufiventris]
MARAGAGPPRELSLEEVLKCYEQPLNEEQAWALCFQGCRAAAAAPVAPAPLRTADIRLRADGSLRLPAPPHDLPALLTPSAEAQMVQSLGFAVYRALDWGLDENEERELSPRLEQLIDLMTNSDSEDSGCATADEGYGGQDEEEEGGEGPPRSVRTFGQAMRCCAARLADPAGAPAHYQAVCRALFAETVELMAFLAKIRDAKELLQKLKEDEEEEERPAAELGNLRNTDWARLWVQLMRELRHGVKLKKVQEKQFNPLPTEYQLTPFEMLMQDIRARNYKLRKVMVDGDIPPRVKKDAHELILDFIRSRPPLKQASERRLRPLPQKQRTLHEKILEEIRQERKLRPVEQKGVLRAMPCATVKSPPVPQEFSHPVESLALTVEEMINVRRVLVKAEMEKFLQSKELYSSLRRGKMKMPSKKLAHIPVYALGFESLPGSLLPKAPPLRRREPFHSLSGPCWRRVEEEFPHIYAQGSVLRDVCSDCAGFVTDVVSSSRRSVAVLNASAASRRHAKARSLYSDAWLK